MCCEMPCTASASSCRSSSDETGTAGLPGTGVLHPVLGASGWGGACAGWRSRRAMHTFRACTAME